MQAHIETQHLTPVFLDHFGKCDGLNRTASEFSADRFHDFCLRPGSALVNCKEILLGSEALFSISQTAHACCQVTHVDSRHLLSAVAYNWERSQVRVG